MDVRCPLMHKLLLPHSKEELLALLQSKEVPISTWSIDGLSDLWKEIECGETLLYQTPEGRILRVINVVKINVNCMGQVLVEDKQFYPQRQRTHRRPHAWVSEKVKSIDYFTEKCSPAIASLQACKRAMFEELNLVILSKSRFVYQEIDISFDESYRYKGLLVEKILRSYEIKLYEHERHDQYKECQFDEIGNVVKETTFCWLRNRKLIKQFLDERTTHKTIRKLPSKIFAH